MSLLHMCYANWIQPCTWGCEEAIFVRTWIAALEIMDVKSTLKEGKELAAGLRHLGVKQGRVISTAHAVQLSIEHNDGLALL